MMEITYGHAVTSLDDPYIRIADMATSATVRAGSPGSMLVDFFPLRESPVFRVFRPPRGLSVGC